jgi:predicted GNAT superfamily acetyltransferase
MNHIQIHDLKSADNKVLSEIFEINEGYTGFLGPLETIEKLKELVFHSNFSIFLTTNGLICAFLVCFRENSEYQSKNYQFFQKRFKKFFYIDRIGVVKTFKNVGLGTFLYREIDKICEKDSLPICAEVNIVPMNKESVNFHEKMGFNMISDAYVSPNYAVRYFEKCM